MSIAGGRRLYTNKGGRGLYTNRAGGDYIRTGRKRSNYLVKTRSRRPSEVFRGMDVEGAADDGGCSELTQIESAPISPLRIRVGPITFPGRTSASKRLNADRSLVPVKKASELQPTKRF